MKKYSSEGTIDMFPIIFDEESIQLLDNTTNFLANLEKSLPESSQSIRLSKSKISWKEIEDIIVS